MNIKLKKILIVIIASLCCFNLNAKDNKQQFKVAVVDGATGSNEILKGRYRLGLEKLGKKAGVVSSRYDIAMGQCVASIMLKKLGQADKSCSEAVTAYQSKKGTHYRYLTSVAYSNRAIVQYKLGRIDSALNDLELAVSIDDNSIVLENLDFLKSKLASSIETEQQIAAD